MSTKTFLTRINGNLLRARLFLGGSSFCTGKFYVEGKNLFNGRFQCTDGTTLIHFPPNGGVLRLSTEPERLKIRNFHLCKEPYRGGEYHFDFEIIEADNKEE